MDKTELVHCFPDEVRKQIVDILKTGDVRKELINNEHMLCYLEVCSMSDPLKKACEELLAENLNENNCIDTLEISEKYSLENLKIAALKVVNDNLSVLKEFDEFQRIQDKHLEELCRTEGITKHEDIYEALDKWRQWKPEERTTIFQSLIQAIQPQIPNDLNSCVHKMEKYRIYHALLLTTGNHKRYIESIVFGSRGKMVHKKQLFHSADIKDDLTAVCVQKDETEAPYLYIVSRKHVVRYDPILNHHDTCHSLTFTRTGASVVSHGDYVYVFGGRHGDKNILEVEELDAKHQKSILHIKKSWKVVASLQEEICLYNAPCNTFQDKVYIIGDIVSDNATATGIVSFSPGEKEFEIVCQLPIMLGKCKAVIYGHTLFIASTEAERHFAKFDLLTKSFTTCSSLPIEVWNFEIFASGKMICIVNYDSNNPESNNLDMLKYDVENNIWTSEICGNGDFPCDMKIHGCCAIKIPADTNVIPFDSV